MGEPNRNNGLHRSLQSEQWQQDALNKHNELRALHGAPPLAWSDDLRANAQLAANENERLGHLQHVFNDDQGQNLYFRSPSAIGVDATQNRYDEVNKLTLRMAVFPLRRVTSHSWCGSQPRTWELQFPQMGSSWLRIIIRQATL